MLRALFLGGLLPVIAFSVIEDRYGVVWGLVAGMVSGVGEILWEWRAQGRVEAITWGGNGMILVLGAVSLFTQQGVWFKMQPAILDVVMAMVLWGSELAGKSLLLVMAKKQAGGNWNVPAERERILVGIFRGFGLRMGLFFAIHGVLAGWAAVHWSTAAWAALKGIGFTVSMILYVVIESMVMRRRLLAKT